MSDNINSQPTIYGPSTLDLAVEGSLQNLQTPLDSQLKYAANVEYVEQYVNQHGGGGSNVPLNITNNAYPLSGTLDLSLKPTLVQTTSDQKSAVNKAYLDLSIQGVEDAIEAEENRAETAETNLATSISTETTRATTEEQKLETEINNISGNTQNITTNSEDNSTTVSGGEIAGIVGASLALLALGATAVVAAAGGASQAATMATTGAAMLTSAATSTASNLGQMLGDIKSGTEAAEFLDSDGFSIDKNPGAETIRDANQNAFEFEEQDEWLQDPYWNDEKIVTKQDFLDRMKAKYGESTYFPSSSEQPSMQFSNEVTAREINGLNDRLVSTDEVREKASALDRVPLSQEQFDKLVAESANEYIVEETLLSDGSWAVTDFKNLNSGETIPLQEPTVYVPRIEKPGIELLGPPVLRTMQTQEVNTEIDPSTVKRKVNPYEPQNTNFAKSYGLHDAVSTTSAIQLIDDYVFPYIEFAQECVDTCEENIANLEERRLDEIPAPLETVSMNNQQLVDLPLVPLNNSAAITSVWAENIANEAVETPESNIDMSNLYKIKNLVAGTDPNDAVTVQQLSGYVPTGLSLTQIEANNIEDLNMFNRKITGLAPGIEPTDAVRMDELPSVTAGNEIINSSGFSKVIVENDQTVRTYCNSNEILRCEESLIVASQPIFQLSEPPADTTNAILSRSELDQYYLNANTTFNSIAITGPRDMEGYTLTNLPDAVQSLDAVNYAEVLSLISENAPEQIAYSTGSSRVECSNNAITMTLQDNSFAAFQFTSSGAGTNSLRNIAYTGNQLNETLNGTNAAQVFKFQGKTGNTPIHLTSAETYSQISGASDAPYIQLLNSGIITVSSSIQQPLIQNPINSASNYLINGADLYNYIESGEFLTQASTINNLEAPTEEVSFAGELLKQLANPVDAEDSATRIFVENTIASSLASYLTSSEIAAEYLTQQDAASTYETPSQVQTTINTALTPYSTTAQMNSAISTAVEPYLLSSSASSTYLTQENASVTYEREDTPFTEIINNSINSVEAESSNSGIKIYGGLSNVKTNILDIFAPAGELPSGTCEIEAKGKLNIVSNSGLTSIMSGLGQSVSTLTIKSAADVPNQIQYDNLVLGSRANCPCLELSSGHDASGNGYSLINNSVAVTANTLQISPEISANVISGNNLLMYGNSVQVSIKNQFNKPTGLAYSQSSPESNEFVTKAYADATYTGGTPSSITSSGNSTVACSSTGIDMTVNLVSATQPLRLSKATNAATFQLDTVTSGFGYLNIGGNLNSVELLSPFFAASGSFSSTLGVVGELTCGNTLLMNGSNNIEFTSGTVLGLPSCGTFSSTNNAPALASDVFGYVTNSTASEETWTITLTGSSTTGIEWANIPANLSTIYAQTQKVKGSATNLITSSTVACVSTTLASSWAIFELECASNVRITQAWAYSTTAAGTSSQENIASLSYSQQASSTAGRTNLELYKPATSEGSDSFILYYVVDTY